MQVPVGTHPCVYCLNLKVALSRGTVGNSLALRLAREDNLHSRKVSFQRLLPRIRELVAQTTDPDCQSRLIHEDTIFAGADRIRSERLFGTDTFRGSGPRCREQRKMGHGVQTRQGADFKAISAQAISECKAKGGADPKIVWSERSNFIPSKGPGNNGFARSTIAHGAIAISDHGTGNIVGWSIKTYRVGKKAIEDCRRKGGQNPKFVARF